MFNYDRSIIYSGDFFQDLFHGHGILNNARVHKEDIINEDRNIIAPLNYK